MYAIVSAAITPIAADAQYNKIISPSIASLQVVAGKNWLSLPVIKLHGTEPINIAFDDLTHVYHRYAYKLIHCEADWRESEGIFGSDYCEGFADGNTIDNFKESINTNTLYTHYQLSIPNEHCRPVISGNYKLMVYDENEEDTVLVACFMVVDPLLKVSMNATSNTDVDTNKEHQQVSMTVGYGALKIRNPQQEIIPIVLQNGMWKDARRNIQPQYVSNGGMTWEHNRSLIFNGGNEYRKFEILSVDNPTLGIEDVWWDGDKYNAQLWTDLPRPNYTYDEDANGSFYIRNSDNVENDFSSEYVNVKFRLKTQKQNKKVFVDGIWTNGCDKRHYALTYNEHEQQYETSINLKQGYYSYRYLTYDNDGKPVPIKSEGNFFQTENKYQGLVYYRGQNQRTDLLAGYCEITFN